MLRRVGWARGSGRCVATALTFALLAGACTTPAGSDAVVADPTSWAARVQDTIDGSTLVGEGLVLPEGANVLVARVIGGGESPAYAYYQAGGGGFVNDFFPASSIKLLAALGALEFAHSLGFSGEAVVDGGYTLREYYDAALRWSSNEDYSALVRIAGVDRLNRVFLPGHGFYGTAIQEPYGAGEQVTFSPEMTLTEGDREVTIPEREGELDYGCGGGNCSSLFDMADAVRRLALDAELPPGDRFDLSAADIAGLQDALAGAEGWIAPGVADVLGPDARILTKPGWVPDLECVEAAFVADPASGHRYVIGLSAPDDGTCEELAVMAGDLLRLLERCGDGIAMLGDGSRVRVVDGRQQGPAIVDGPLTTDCRGH